MLAYLKMKLLVTLIVIYLAKIITATITANHLRKSQALVTQAFPAKNHAVIKAVNAWEIPAAVQ
jgi:hypothetical protein